MNLFRRLDLYLFYGQRPWMAKWVGEYKKHEELYLFYNNKLTSATLDVPFDFDVDTNKDRLLNDRKMCIKHQNYMEGMLDSLDIFGYELQHNINKGALMIVKKRKEK